ncbi:uncharacterized protein BDW47DRAFT_116451 [Aspergillus candidus]|uniref:Protein kinase domain-containing protein n=1 Tax=Aspergillus candidus TaxID=41067 RepID=A0A2I2FGA3_ASPCN|nr:hypothetical protein BDW47DRAFT_116451 [Aspergillus candidus]PLB39655.1 hypothetical protein BDW47DRAFT_116451 [Aspergillus candidus]
MTETYFFHSDIIGKEIHFFENYVSTWILERKIGEMNDQLTALNYEEFQKASGAYGTFICSQRNNRNNVAIIKIFLQVPYQGSEHAIHAERARQATQTLPMAGQEQLDALRILTANHCVSTPTLLSQKIEQQSQDSPLVPGGFAVYLLIEHAQGIQLTEAIFWAFKRQERDRVREAVKSAWEKAAAAGIAINPGTLENIFYDPVTQSAILTGFEGSEKVLNSRRTWNNKLWVSWDLVVEGPGFSFNFFDDSEPDMSSCKF